MTITLTTDIIPEALEEVRTELREAGGLEAFAAQLRDQFEQGMGVYVSNVKVTVEAPELL